MENGAGGDGGRRGDPGERPRRTTIYSLIVGIAFVALIAVAGINTDLDQEQGRPRRHTTRGICRSPSSRCRTPGPAPAVTPTSPRTIATRRRIPCPSGSTQDAGVPGRRPRRDPGLRSLRQAPGPLVLVHRGGDCEDQEDVFERAYRRYCGEVNFLAIDVRDSDSGGPQADRGAPLDPSGRARSRRRALQPLPRRRVPDLRLRISRRHPAAHLDRPARRPARSSPRSTTCIAAIQAEGRDSALMAELPDEWEVAPEPGWIEPALAEEFPGLSIVSTAVEATDRTEPRGAQGAAAGAQRPDRRAAGDPASPAADSLGLPRLLPAHRARPRHDPHPDRAADLRAHPRRHASRAATASTTR